MPCKNRANAEPRSFARLEGGVGGGSVPKRNEMERGWLSYILPRKAPILTLGLII